MAEVVPAVGAVGPRAGRPVRRTFSAEDKRRLVAEYDATPRGEKGAMLRRERLYDSHITEWRAVISAGTLDLTPKRGRPKGSKTTRSPEQVRIAELERENAKLRGELDKTEQALAVKVRAMSQVACVAWQTESVEKLTPLVGVVTGCWLVGRSRATHHRRTNPKPLVLGPRRRPVHPAKLSTAERAEVLGLFASDAYADMSVNQVWARELDQGRYWCSVRTMYRILAAAEMSGGRRRQATHPPQAIPELVATSVNAVWSWDITKMRGSARGMWFHAYVVIDIFSRYLLEWMDAFVGWSRHAGDLGVSDEAVVGVGGSFIQEACDVRSVPDPEPSRREGRPGRLVGAPVA